MTASEDQDDEGHATGTPAPVPGTPGPAPERGLRGSDFVPRCIGMAIGAGAGTLFLTIVGPRIDFRWVAWLPGAGLVLCCGLFSFRRSPAWGPVAALLGIAAMLLGLWTYDPARVGLAQFLWLLVTDVRGVADFVLIAVLGILVGPGWEKSWDLGSDEDEE